jgi:hypothetical protein
MQDVINLPPPLRLKVFSKAGGICANCGKRIDGSREQWAAVRTTSVGDDSSGNFAPVHVQCGAEPVADAASDVQKARASWPNKRSLPFSRKSPLKRKVSGRIVRREG